METVRDIDMEFVVSSTTSIWDLAKILSQKRSS